MPPIRFAFGLHLHQPVGNFDYVFAQHVEDVYRPLLDALADREFLPVVLHLSGPLLDWLEQHEPAYLDRLGRLVGASGADQRERDDDGSTHDILPLCGTVAPPRTRHHIV